MKTKILHWLTLISKAVGVVGMTGTIPFLSPEKGLLVFAAASLLKDTVNRIGDLVDDGVKNDSFKT